MSITIQPQKIDKTIIAPASKSVMQRVAAIASLANSPSKIYNYEICNDSEVALSIIRNLGSTVTIYQEYLFIQPKTKKIEQVINCGESGLSVRMFSPIASIFGLKFTFTGEGSLLKRPINIILDALSKFGVSGQTNKNFLPLNFEGKLQGRTAKIDGSISSQVLTGLLTALPFAEKNSELLVENLKSKPYIALTLSILKDFGIQIENSNFSTFNIPGNQQCKGKEYYIEGDWSAASFLLVAGLIAGEVTIKGLKLDSKQADIAILNVIAQTKGKIDMTENYIKTNKSELSAFDFDATDCPDLFPPLTVLAVACQGVSTIKGISRLKNKESDRGIVIQKEFKKVGIEIELKGDIMKIIGKQPSGGVINSHNDHRIAMAAALLGCISETEITIEDERAVNKSYPNFFKDLGFE